MFTCLYKYFNVIKNVFFKWSCNFNGCTCTLEENVGVISKGVFWRKKSVHCLFEKCSSYMWKMFITYLENVHHVFWKLSSCRKKCLLCVLDKFVSYLRKCSSYIKKCYHTKKKRKEKLKPNKKKKKWKENKNLNKR